MIFGQLAHAGLEALRNSPAADPAALAADLVAAATLPVASYRASFERELAALLDRCRQSPLAALWRTHAETRTEVRFTLSLERGLVHGVVDYVGRGADGLWELVDYKTGHRTNTDEAVQHYRLQLEIYALCVQALHPDQSEYRATLYFTDFRRSAPCEFHTCLSNGSPHPPRRSRRPAHCSQSLARHGRGARQNRQHLFAQNLRQVREIDLRRPTRQFGPALVPPLFRSAPPDYHPIAQADEIRSIVCVKCPLA